MPIPNSAVDDLFRNYAVLLLRRQNLLLTGKDDDPETDEVEDRLSAAWEKLSEDQRLSLNGMASDLNWVRRRGTPPLKGRKPEEVTEQERQLLAEPETRGDWLKALHFLRVCGPVLDIQNLARRRAAAYARLGFPRMPTYAADSARRQTEVSPSWRWIVGIVWWDQKRRRIDTIMSNCPRPL